MPFTLAHPAAILPFTFLKKKWYSFTGLIIGSVIPDIEGFLNPGEQKVVSHTWWGALWYDLPLGLLAAFIFHYIVRRPIIDNLPGLLYNRFAYFKSFGWGRYFLRNAPRVIISLLVGIATHLIWDRVTHTDTYGYAEQAGIILPPDEKTELRIVLQYLSTIVGTAFMFWWIWKQPLTSSDSSRRPWWPYWFIVAAVMVLTFLFLPRGPIVALDYDIANTGMTGGLLGILVASAFCRLGQKT